MLSESRIAEIRKRKDAATPGPWTTEKPERDEHGWAKGVLIAAVGRNQGIYANPPSGQFPDADRRFIAGAITDVSDLLAEREERQWVSVKDRLPKKGVNVLLWLNHNWATVGALWDRGWGEEFTNEADFPSECVTHWMPLPVAPEVK